MQRDCRLMDGGMKGLTEYDGLLDVLVHGINIDRWVEGWLEKGMGGR